MTWCEFEPAGASGEYRCVHCQRTVSGIARLPIRRLCIADGAAAPPSLHRPLARGPCVHLGEMTRLEQCATCNGGVQVKVFACAVFGETTLGKGLPGVACCSGCAEYRAE